MESMTPPPQVSIFWDLDNKPPPPLVSAFSAAFHLKTTAAAFGSVRETLAFANRHAFNHVPDWVREQRRERKILDILERRGMVSYVQPNPYTCGLCGRKCKTNLQLKEHFKQLHERERGKRLARLEQLKGKKKDKFRDAMAASEGRYRAAAREVLVPEKGYYLRYDLHRAGVLVRMVADKPEAADEAIKQRMKTVQPNDVIVVVSDDSGFGPALRQARCNGGVKTVVVGGDHGGRGLARLADAWLPWEEVGRGLGKDRAANAVMAWRKQQKLTEELLRGTRTLLHYVPLGSDEFSEGGEQLSGSEDEDY